MIVSIYNFVLAYVRLCVCLKLFTIVLLTKSIIHGDMYMYISYCMHNPAPTESFFKTNDTNLTKAYLTLENWSLDCVVELVF